MPRRAREKSNSGIYHVMLRGINKQDIFHDEEDKVKFIDTLKKYKEISQYKIYGYCLMSNHIHLLIKEGKETLSQAMKRIGVSYVYWYNLKYDRYGHLFQDRYKSESVEDEKYLLVVLRYIHQNPIKAGMVEDVADYRWSSYTKYIDQKDDLIDTGFVLSILGPNRKKAIEIFAEFMDKENKDTCLDIKMNRIKQLSDEDVRKLIKKITKTNNIQILLLMNKNDRDEVIKEIKSKEVSIRQLARITGLGRRVIEKAR